MFIDTSFLLARWHRNYPNSSEQDVRNNTPDTCVFDVLWKVFHLLSYLRGILTPGKLDTRASETITLYSVIEERPPGNRQPTELDSISTISVSAILNVDGIVTEYAVSEVITQIVEDNVVGTQTIPSTVLTTPITLSCTWPFIL